MRKEMDPQRGVGLRMPGFPLLMNAEGAEIE